MVDIFDEKSISGIEYSPQEYVALEDYRKLETALAAANCPKCFACGAELDTYAKCITCFDKIGAERDVLLKRERALVVDKEYLQEYILYLIGGYTKEEFKRVAYKYAESLSINKSIKVAISAALAEVTPKKTTA